MAIYRFLKDHAINGLYYQAGDIAASPAGWTPTADVEPLDSAAVLAFYNRGPSLGGIINTQWTGRVVTAPVTYWYQVSANRWALTGLGSDQGAYPPKGAVVQRVE
jgi:bacillopeptidase F (M6 metalloprotease family)